MSSFPAGTAAWPCRPGGRLSETLVAFARWCLRGIETAIAFAGEKWAFLVQFSGAKVMAVSAVPCWGRAVVLLVSRSLERPCRASLLCRVPGSRALLLAPLTRSCAAKPYWWHGGQPAQTATSRVNVRIKGAHVRRMRSQEQKQKRA